MSVMETFEYLIHKCDRLGLHNWEDNELCGEESNA